MSVVTLRQAATENASASAAVQELVSALGGKAELCCLVGGAVRDFALGLSPRELDVVVAGDAHALLADLDLRDIRYHERFLTATVDFSFGTVDFASSRRETYAAPGALPDVELGSVEEDRLRRDFTVNALRMDLASLATGDDGQGWEDLEVGILRVLRKGSFVEDPTRIWRLARYCGRLGFVAEPATRAEAEAALRAGVMATVSRQRVGAELLRTIAEAEPDGSILESLNLGLVAPADGADEVGRRLDRMLALVAESVPRRELRLAAVCASGYLQGSDDLSELELGEELMQIVRDISDQDKLVGELDAATKPSQVDEACAGWAPAVVALVGERLASDKVAQWFSESREVSLPIGGSDLLALGIAEGPELGRGLRAARAVMLDEGIDDPEQLLKIAAAEAGGQS
jgi:tRNA nucleotidyltransferase (CCA-adding enzyme)